MPDNARVDFELDPVTVQEPEPRTPAEQMLPPIEPEPPLARSARPTPAAATPHAPAVRLVSVQDTKPTAHAATPHAPAARLSIAWRDAYATGIPQVDKDHKHLFSLINMLELNTLSHVLDELIAYVAEHFQHEEELMQLSGYPEADKAAHFKQHEQFTNSVAKAVASVVTWTPETIERLRSFGLKWLVGHILNTDAKFGRWFREHPIEYTMDAEGHFHKVPKSWFSKMFNK